MELNNKYYIMRHGEAESNAKNIVSSWPEKFRNHLTTGGNNAVVRAVQILKDKNINLIFASDLIRTKETAEIVGDILSVNPKYDERLREIDFGIFNGKPVTDFENYFKNKLERIDKITPGGENYKDVLSRIAEFFKEINSTHKDKNILVISHQLPLFLLEGYAKGFSLQETIENIPEEKLLNKAEIRELN